LFTHYDFRSSRAPGARFSFVGFRIVKEIKIDDEEYKSLYEHETMLIRIEEHTA